MKSRVELLSLFMTELVDLGYGVSLQDIREVERRDRSDRTFLDVQLPLLDDALLALLSTGQLPKVEGFRGSRQGCYPLFLQGLWSRICDSQGQLLDNPSVDSIYAVRQISRLFKKVFEVCSPDIVSAYEDAFIEVDRSLVDYSMDEPTVSTIFSRLFGPMLSRIYHLGRTGSHGPGAVAERLDSVARWDFSSLHPDIIEHYGEDFFFVSRQEYLDRYPRFDPASEFGRLVAVPKTASKPRLISIEPSSHQFVQQGLKDLLYKELSKYPVTNILDQTRNRELARIGSKDGSLATLDLSEASDRLSVRLLQDVTRNHSWFYRELMLSRTKAVIVGRRGLVPLNKFASMGSALTFPVQVMVFTTLVFKGLVDAGIVSLDQISDRSLRRPDVGVYGDDIIVPVSSAASVAATLERASLRVNLGKSFSTGLFRESCGGDYYAGQDVSPVYVRRSLPLHRRDVSSLVSWADMAWKFHALGFWETAKAISEHVSSYIGPCRGERTPPLDYRKGSGVELGVSAVTVPFGTLPRSRWNSQLQRAEWRYPRPRVVRREVECTERARLAFAIANVKGGYTGLRGGVPEYDPRALTHHGRPVGALMAHRWTSLNSWGG